MNSTVTAVESLGFLGSTVSQDLKWDIHIESIVKKAQQRLYFLHQLRSCHRSCWNRSTPHYWIRPLHVNTRLDQLSYQQKTTEGSPDCWANHWYNPPHSPRTVLIQSEQKSWQNHSGPSHPAHSLFELFWSMLQSSEHQNGQTQEQFLPSGNPSHEHQTIMVEHTLFYTLTYLTHTYLVNTSITHTIHVQTKLSVVIYLYIIVNLHIVIPLIYLFFFIICVFVILLYCGASVLKTNSSYV